MDSYPIVLLPLGCSQVVATIDGRKDIQGGRLATQRISAKNSNLNKCYTSICYSADGGCLLAGGATKYVEFSLMVLASSMTHTLAYTN